MSERPFASVKTFLLILVCFAVWLTVAFFGFGCGPVRPPAQPKPPPDQTAAKALCDRIWLEELLRPIDSAALGPCVAQVQSGVLEATIRAQVKASPEWAEVHKPPPSVPFGKIVRSRLKTSHGTGDANPPQIVYSDGQRFEWSEITGFALLEQVAHGKPAQARAWLKDVRTIGFTVARVLAMNRGWLELSPEDGRRALPELLKIANEEDIHIRVTALSSTDTRSRAFLDEQVKAVGAACAANISCAAVEIANEPYSGSQHKELYKPSTMAKLRALIPKSVVVGYGAPSTLGITNKPGADELLDSAWKVDGEYNDGRYMSGGDVVFIHMKRNKDIYDDLRRYSETYKLARKVNKVVIDGERFGFAETATVGENTRRTEAFVGRAQGTLSQLFNLPSCFHTQDGLLAKPLGPKQRAAAIEFIAGRRSVSAAAPFKWVNAKAGASAVKDASFIGPSCGGCAVMRGFSFFSPRGNYFAWVGMQPVGGGAYRLPNRSPQPQWQNGWKPKAVLAERPGFQVIELSK